MADDGMLLMPEQESVYPLNPQSQIILASGIPWTNDYNHVRLFDSKDDLLSFVRSRAIITFSNSTPVRWGTLSYRANGNENTYIDCNYIAFQNYPFTTDWKFGFVTDVEWLSNGSCNIHFEPDYFQNNIYDVTILPCFVEREHVAKAADTYYANLQPEGLETGEYIADAQYTPQNDGWAYSMLASATSEGGQPTPALDNNVYSGLLRYSTDSSSSMTSQLNNYQMSGIADAVVQVTQYPDMCYENSNEQIIIPACTSIDGYVPKNNKLFQYPYCYVLFTTASNQTATFNFELTERSDHGLSFRVYAITGVQPMIHLTPEAYRSTTGNNHFDDIFIDCSIQCAWTNDAYQAYIAQMTPVWQAQQKQVTVNQITSGINGIFSTLSGLVSGNVLGGISSGMNSLMNIMTAPYLQQTNMQAQKESHDLIPPSARGSTSGATANAAFVLSPFYLYRMTIKAEMARCIDDYFTAFGYATNQIKTPNLHSRSSWNFVKTNGANFSGNIMLDDRRKLQAMFDRGVTIWHTNDVGNYSLAND